MATRAGTIKRTALGEFTNLRKSGLIAIVLREDDELIRVVMTDGQGDVLLGTKNGMAIRFSEDDMRPIGRAAMGVKAIELDEGDEVVDMAAVEEGAQVLSLTEQGYGKRTEIDEYRVQSRGGKGVKAMNLTEKTGSLVCQLLVHDGEDVLIITDEGVIIRTPVGSISSQGRNTQGVRIMRVNDGKVVGVARAEAEEEEEIDSFETAEGASSLAPEETFDISERTTNESGEPDALDRLVVDLEERPEPEEE